MPSVFQSSRPFGEQVLFQSSALCNCQILSIPLVGSCSISLSRSFSLSFCHSIISLSLSLSGYLSTAEFHNPASQFWSVCFLAASLLRLHSPTPLFPSSRFLPVLLPPPSSSCYSVRGVQESKKERFQGMGEEGRKEGIKRKKETRNG